MSEHIPEENINPVSLLDMKRVRELRESDDSERLDVILFDVFKSDGAGELRRIEEACETRNPEQLAGHAHKLRGMCANLGMHALGEQLTVIEAEARNTRLSLNYGSIASDLRILYHRTAEAYEAYLVESS